MTRRERDPQAARERCKTLAGFIREFFPLQHPGQPYVHSWNIDFLCAHLEAITFGKFLALGLSNRLLANVPPGTMKSLLVNVFWPAWEWGPCGLGWLQYVATSHRDDLCARDSRRMRAVVESEKYRTLWPMELIRAAEMSFENDKGGWRESIPIGSLTGGRGHRLLIDDPHSIDGSESDATRERTVRNFRESASQRMADPATSAIVLIMQRLHQGDLSGIAVDEGFGYVHVMLPMEFEPDRCCISPLINKTDCLFGRAGEPMRDPRTYDGQLLWPERFPRWVVERDKIPLGAFGVAGQLQQRPSPREGGLFKRHWFKFLPHAPPDAEMVGVNPNATAKWVRHWDLASSTQQRSARTAGVKMGKTRDGRYIVSSVIVTRSEGHEVRSLIRSTAEMDGRACEVSLPQDPGQAGKTQKQDLIAMLAGFVAHARPETGDKYTRAEPFSSQCEAGNVYLVEGAWNSDYIDELCMFPAGTLKDQVDASSGAFGRLPKTKAEPSFAVPPAIPGRPRDVPPGGTAATNWSGRPERGG
jgi:predicted phage terminase large subunit-like protein